MTVDPRDAARTLALVNAIKKRILIVDKHARAVALAAMRVTERQPVELDDGTPVGTVSVVHGSRGAHVIDDAAFLAWVAANHPTEIETVTTTRVRPGYLAAVLTAAKNRGAPVTRDGELIDGVTVTRGDPSVTVKQTDDQVDDIAAAWLRREITFPLLPELPAGDTSESETTP